MDAVAEVLNEHRGDGQRNKGEEGEAGADAIHEGQRGGGEDDGVGAVHDRGGEGAADGVEVVGGARHDVASAVGVIEAGSLAFEVAEEVVAEIELDLARGPDDDLPGDVEEYGGQGCDNKQAKGVMDDFGFCDAVLHVIDGVADDDGNEDLDGVVEDDCD